VTGLLVNNSEAEWRLALERLVVDHELRNCIRQNARAYVANHYSLDNAVATWRQTISEVAKIDSGLTLWNYSLCGKSRVAILLDEASEYHMKFNPSRMNFFLEALDGLQFRNHFTLIRQNATQQTVTSLVEELGKSHGLLFCMARDRRLRGYCLKSASSVAVPFCIDVADDSLVDTGQSNDYEVNNLVIISDRQKELKNVWKRFCICDLSPNDRETYYSLGSPVCKWMEVIFSLRILAPGPSSLSASVLALFNRLTGYFKVRFFRVRNHLVLLLRYGKQVGTVLFMNIRKRY
jgi:hypothetical protein